MKKLAPLFILIAGILWGCIGLFVRPLNAEGLSSMEIVMLRSIVTCLAMLLFLLCTNRSKLKIRLKHLWCFIGTGIISIIFFNYCYFTCITLTSLSVAAILLYTAPAIVMVLSFFLFQERFTLRKVLALVITFIGCVLVTGVVGSTEALAPMGILIGLGAGLGYALYSIFSRYAIIRGYDSMTITFYTFLFASIGSLFLADTGKVFRIATADYSIILFCIAFGIVSTVIPYLTYTLGLKYTETGKASIIASIEPVTAVILGFFVYNEELSPAALLGVVLVIGAIIMNNK